MLIYPISYSCTNTSCLILSGLFCHIQLKHILFIYFNICIDQFGNEISSVILEVSKTKTLKRMSQHKFQTK